MRKLIAILCTLILGVATILGGWTFPNTATLMVNDGEPSSFNATATVLIDNFQSDYKIVIPKKASQMEKYASEELQLYLYESTGCKLSIITDEGLAHDNTQKYLSVGNTSLLSAQNDIVIDYAVMGETGPSIDTVGNTVYMVGAASYGTLYSVYKFLYYQIGFKTYAYDCVTYDYNSKLYLLDFDYHYVPNVEWIVAHDHEVYGSDLESLKAAAKLNLFGYANDGGYEMFEGQIYNGLWCHSMQGVMSKDAYPWAWKNDQLCLSNPEVIKTFGNIVAKAYASTATGPAVMLGNNDNTACCDCDGCKVVKAKYGGGMLMLNFINGVADIVEDYFEENNIDKEIIIVGLFYLAYTAIPVTKNSDGSYTPIDETVKFDKEGKVTTGACYAPIEACYMHPFGDECCEKNELYTENMRKLATLTDQIFIYTYGSNWSGGYAHSLWFNNWSTFAASYKFFEEIGVRYVFDEANRHGISPFSSMRVYIRSQMAWDGDYNFYELVDEFTDAYYGIVAEDMKEYFYTVLEHYQSIYARSNQLCQSCYFSFSNQKYWPRETMLNFITILENAMHKIERSDLNEKDKAIYMERVEREWYIAKLDEYLMYKNNVDGETLAELKDIFEEGKDRYVIVGQNIG